MSAQINTTPQSTERESGARRNWNRPTIYNSMPICLIAGLILTLCASFSILPVEVKQGIGTIEGCIFQICESLPQKDDSIFLIAVWACITILLRRTPIQYLRRNPWIVILSILLAFSMLIGSALDAKNTLGFLVESKVQILKSASYFISWTVIACCAIALLFSTADSFTGSQAEQVNASSFSKSTGLKKVERAFSRHPIIFPLLIILITWLSTIIGYAPGLCMGDTLNQIQMQLNHPNSKTSMVDLIDPSVTITGHYPVLHTLLLGGCIQAGITILNNANAGLMLYTIIQTTTLLAAIGYGFNMLEKTKAAITCRLAVLFVLCVSPWYSSYAVLATKDTIFAAGILVMTAAIIMLNVKGNKPADLFAFQEYRSVRVKRWS